MILEFIIILTVNYIGIFLSTVFNLPIPGAILGMILMFLFLKFKIIKIEKIDTVASFLLANMAIFFIPPTMRILDLMHLVEEGLFRIVVLLILTTFITMGVTGKVVELMINFLDKNKKQKLGDTK